MSGVSIGRKIKRSKHTRVEEHRDENGELHREDGPAVVHRGGTVEYYKHGLRHREDGPAIKVIDENGEFEGWYIEGVPHREGKPALVQVGTRFAHYAWYTNGRRHRLDGPAVVQKGIAGFQYEAYYIKDKALSKEGYNQEMRRYKLALLK